MQHLWKRTLLITGATLISSGMVYAQTPDLSDPPDIEGDTVGDHGSVTMRLGLGLAESSPQYLSSEYFADILDKRSGGALPSISSPTASWGMTCR